MFVCRMTPSSHCTSRCLPWLSTDSIVRPARGVMPTRRGASKHTIFSSTSGAAQRCRGPVDRVALRHRTATVRGAARGLADTPAGATSAGRQGSSPTWARARRMRRSWPPVIWVRTELADGLGRREPREVEGLLGRLAVAVDGHDVGQADGVVARVVEPAAVGVREVLDDRERRRVGRQTGQGQRAEVLLEVAHEGVADPLAEQHAAADDHPADRAVGGDPQQHADLGHPPQAVDADRDGVHVDERDVGPHELQVLGRQPAGRGLGRCIHVTHLVGRVSRTGPGPPPACTGRLVSATLRRGT